ncbi:MAG: hypothetical protein NTY09_01445 [bacterium]|nr:hypothetical protein [bacterium]
MLGGLFQGIANVSKISTYFEDLKTKGWEVDDSQSNQPSGYGANVESETPMIWKARENPEDDWTLYVWTLSADTEAMNRLGEGKGNQFNWSDLQAMMNFTLTPRTEAALEVHRELGLPLPDDFELEPWDESGGDSGDSGTDRNRDKVDNGDTGGEDEGASTDSGDEGTTSGDDETDSGSTRPHKGAGYRKAA